MSKRPSKNGVPHLSFQAQSGFQFYLTLPKQFALGPSFQLRFAGRLVMTSRLPVNSQPI